VDDNGKGGGEISIRIHDIAPGGMKEQKKKGKKNSAHSARKKFSALRIIAEAGKERVKRNRWSLFKSGRNGTKKQKNRTVNMKKPC